MAIQPFDWAKLNRSSIYNVVSKCRKELVNKTLYTIEVHRIISKQVKHYLPIRVKRILNAETDFGWIYIGGLYYNHLDQESKPSITLVLQYNMFDETITLTATAFKRICTAIADTLLHEALHMKQYRARKFKDLPEYASTAEDRKQRITQTYLACTDEIDSYGFNIACELNTKFKGNDDSIIEYLNKLKHRKVRTPDTWIKYLKAFDNDHNNAIIKRIKKRVTYYLPYAKVGSPFKALDRLKQ
jgi:hypothetical protein